MRMWEDKSILLLLVMLLLLLLSCGIFSSNRTISDLLAARIF
jgi:hypothetical protein